MTGILDERAREILRLRFQEDLLQSEIAEHVGCSQMHVSRIIRSSLERLYTYGSRERRMLVLEVPTTPGDAGPAGRARRAGRPPTDARAAGRPAAGRLPLPPQPDDPPRAA